MIACKLHLDKYLNCSEWDNESRRIATSALAGISNSKFCVVFTTIIKSLFYLQGPTKKIQGRNLDLYNVVGLVMVAPNNLVFAWIDEENKFFARCFEYPSELAGPINVTPSMPQIASRQQHRPNAESNTLFDYYCVNICLPFLDHIINGIDVRCDKYGKIVLAMAGLVRSVIAENDVSVIDILDMYSDDLPSPLHFNDEVICWKRRWNASEVSTLPDTVAKALKKCDDEMYPNLSALLKICGTVAVTLCECE